MKYGLSPVEQWDKGFSAFDDEIRKMDIKAMADKPIDFDDEKWLAAFKKNLELVINRTLDVYERGEKLGKDSPFYRNYIIGRLGIKYELDKAGDIVITDMETLINDLKEYQEVAVMQRDARSGKVEARKRMTEVRAKRRNSKAESQEAIKAEQKRIVKENKGLLNSFFESDSLTINLVTENSDDSLEDEETGTEIVAGYVKRDDSIISNTDNGLVSYGYEKEGKKRVVIKENSQSLLDKSAPEKYLNAKRVQDEALLMPLVIKADQDKTIRIYEAAQTDLDKYLLNQPEGKMQPRLALSIIIRLANAVGKLHKVDLVHGDIHPGNMFVFPGGVKLGDFDESYIKNFQKEGVGGNRFIMAPEMFVQEGVKKFDKTVDIYSLSASLYKMIVGRWPHEIDDSGMDQEDKQNRYSELHKKEQVSYPDSVPAAISRIIEKGLSVKPADRYQNIDYFLNDLLKVYNSI